jgi:hypothetical protein
LQYNRLLKGNLAIKAMLQNKVYSAKSFTRPAAGFFYVTDYRGAYVGGFNCTPNAPTVYILTTSSAPSGRVDGHGPTWRDAVIATGIKP